MVISYLRLAYTARKVDEKWFWIFSLLFSDLLKHNQSLIHLAFLHWVSDRTWLTKVRAKSSQVWSVNHREYEYIVCVWTELGSVLDRNLAQKSDPANSRIVNTRPTKDLREMPHLPRDKHVDSLFILFNSLASLFVLARIKISMVLDKT